MRRAHFVVVLRLDEEQNVRADAAYPAAEAAQRAAFISLRHRFNPDMRAVLLPAPAGATPEAMFAAIDALTLDERRRLYAKGKNLA